MSGMARRLLLPVASAAAFLALWGLAAWIAQSRLLPGPVPVAAAMIEAARSGSLLADLAATLRRTVLAFVLAMGLGAALGYVLGRRAVLDRLVDPWIVLLLNLPALVVIILVYVWFGLTETAAVAAVAINKLPNTVVVVREGAKALDPMLDDVARVFRFGGLRRMRHVVLPQLAPYLMAAARSGLSLVWKIVLLVELLGRPDGIGFALGTAFQLFDVKAILANALAFVLVMLVIETLLVQPLKDAANAGAADRLDVHVASKGFRGADGARVDVLRDLSFTLPAGSFGGLIGPSGCGKTTILRLIAGLDVDFAGEIRRPGQGRLAMVFQEPALLPWRTVEENVRLCIESTGSSSKGLDDLFDTLGLAGHRSRYPGELSLGLARRAALARAFAVEPDLLLLDEPFVSLDAPTAERLRTELASLQAARRPTSLLVTHDLAEALHLCDRLFLLGGTPARIMHAVDVDVPRAQRRPETLAPLLAEVRAALGHTG